VDALWQSGKEDVGALWQKGKEDSVLMLPCSLKAEASGYLMAKGERRLSAL